MSQLYLIAFDILMPVLLAACLRHAWRRGEWANVWQLLAGVIFGWLLEWATIEQLHAYSYGPFPLKIGPLPLSIGLGWGVIIYTARLFSDASNLPHWSRPLLDALLALNIDLAMDAIAIRLGMWDWGRGLTFEYFGVPYANFWAWFWVVFSFSLFLRLFLSQPYRAAKWLAPFWAILFATLTLLGTNALIVYVLVPANLYGISILGVFLAAILLVVSLRSQFNLQPVAPIAFWVPFSFHAFFLISGLISGSILQPPFLLVVSLGMLSISVWLHIRSIPFFNTRFKTS
ncbi:MAG: carotenoid biosynthesis protein [Anaerolineales bacterium]|nr:carotenoid biosynthesis protein [Anaerolineales bacterium]